MSVSRVGGPSGAQDLPEVEAQSAATLAAAHSKCPSRALSCGSASLRRRNGRFGITRKWTGACGCASAIARHRWSSCSTRAGISRRRIRANTFVSS